MDRPLRRDSYAPIKAANAAARAKRDRTVLAKYAAGKSTAVIAKLIGMNVKTVQRILKANGVLRRGRLERRAPMHPRGPVLLFGPYWMRGKCV